MSRNFNPLVPNEYIFYIKDDYIQVHSNGVKNLEFAISLWTRVVEECKANNIFKVLGIALTSDPLQEDEADEMLPIFKELGLDKEYKIAWVELNPEFFDICLYSERLISANGVDVKFLYEVEHARNWLLKKHQPARQSSDLH